jgi:hypothetical protein
MLISISGGWTKDKGRDELDAKVKIVGDDAQEVAHLQSLLDDDWTVEGVSFNAGELTLDVKATRKVTLAEQAAAEKAAADDKAAADAEAAKVAAEAQAKQAEQDAHDAKIAAAAAKAAVEALKK